MVEMNTSQDVLSSCYSRLVMIAYLAALDQRFVVLYLSVMNDQLNVKTTMNTTTQRWGSSKA